MAIMGREGAGGGVNRDVQSEGVSTRKVETISEELCGHSFSASAISGFNKKLDEELGRFAAGNWSANIPI